MPISPLRFEPIHGATHDVNFVRFLAEKSAGYDGSYVDYVSRAGPPSWTIRYGPAAGSAPAESFERFLQAKARGFTGNLADFMRDGFSTTVPQAGTTPTKEAKAGDATSSEAPSSGRRHGGEPGLSYLINLYSGLKAEADWLNGIADTVYEQLVAGSTPTSLRRVAADDDPVRLTLREALLTRSGPDRKRHNFMPALPELPPRLAWVPDMWSKQSLMRAIRILQERLAVLPGYIDVGEGTLCDWYAPRERRSVTEPASGTTSSLDAAFDGGSRR